MKRKNKSIDLISEQDSKIYSSNSSSSSIPHVILIDENDSKSKNISLSNDFVCKNEMNRFHANKYSQSSTSSLTSLSSTSDYCSTVKKEEYVDNKGVNCIPIKIESSDDDDDVIIVKQDPHEDDLKIIEIDEESDDSVRLVGHKRSAASKRRKPKKIWNFTDIELLFDGIELYGSKWNKVASHVGNDFKSIQCKRRWEIIKRQFTKQYNGKKRND